MTHEECTVEPVTPLPTALQQRYDQLEEPQCTNLTYINTFRNKMLQFIKDAEIRDILSHLSEAASNLNRINLELTGSSCPQFSYREHLQIYDQMAEAYHAPTPVSMFCILTSLNLHIRTLLKREETYILDPCDLII